MADTVYVDASATGADDGSTWADACTSLQGGLTAAGAGDEVWVARGTYKPTGGIDRAATFQMKTDVSLYGGFTNGAASLADRDWDKHATVLSGEIGSALHNDNSLHVVTCTGASGVTFDGFTVTRGYAWDSGNDADPFRDGGGFLVYNSEVFPTIQNCRFIDNSANYKGGGIALLYNTAGAVGPVVSNCYFANNNVWRGNTTAEGGGGIFMFHRKPFLVEDCTFTSNSARWGAGMRAEYANTTLRRSLFFHNTAGHSGSGAYISKVDPVNIMDTEIVDCQFYANTHLYNGALYLDRSYHAGDVMSNCLFYANKATTYSVHAIYLAKYNGLVADCVFSGNKNYTPSAGAAVTLFYSDPTFRRVAIVGSESAHHGAGVYDNSSGGSEPKFENVIIAGNRCRYDGAGACLYTMSGNTASFMNCVIVDNEMTESSATYGGGGLFVGNGTASITNCIIWNNRAAGSGDNVFVKGAASELHVGNNDIEGGLAGIWNPDSAGITNNGGNINTNPLFIVETGTWSVSGVYDDSIGMTILTGSGASWETNELAGKFVKPDSNSGSFIYYIAANTKTTISILGDATDEAKITPYSISDYDLPINSPCVDAGSSTGAPDHDFVLTPRPQPFGGAFDIGIREYIFDSSAPDDISGLMANPEHEQIVFGWTNPTNADYKGLLVLRREGAAPTGIPTDTNSYIAGASIGDGVVAYVGTGTNDAPDGNSSWINTDLVNGVTYHYRFFTFDGKPNYSAGVLTNDVPINDDTAPSDVTDLAIAGGDHQAALSWTNPIAIDFEGVLILRRTLGRAGIPEDKKAYSIDDPIGGGTVVHVGTGSDGTPGAASSWTDTGLDNATKYYYQVFARDEAPNYSSGLETNTTTDADTLSPGAVDILVADASDAQVALTWWNPGATDFEGVLVLRRTGAAPTGVPTDNSTYSVDSALGDGTIVYVGAGANGDPSGFSGWQDSGLPNGSNYYYAVFAYDEVLNYSAASEANATPSVTDVIYVDWNASGGENGSSWTDAYTNLQDALGAVVAGGSIWAAEGTYKPGLLETSCFDMKDGVNMYGGFTNGMGSIAERDWNTHETILSGDIDNDGLLDAENAYHVLQGADQAILDGFTVTMGYADTTSDPNQAGGGLYVWETADYPSIYNCSFVTNAAYRYGGALCLRYADGGSEGPTVSNCYFAGNYTWYAGNGSGGGAIYGYHRRPITILDSTFTGNSANDSDGGAIFTEHSHPIIRDCIFAGNVANRDAGAVWITSSASGPRYPMEISGCVFYENTSGYWGGACYVSRTYYSADVIEDCDFYSNESTDYGGGGLYLNTYDGVVRNCKFSGNRIAPSGANSRGGGIQMESSDCDIQNVIVAGSVSAYRGGGIFAGTDSRPHLENVVIAGCRARYDGGGICLFDLDAPESRAASLVNCTIVSNETYDTGVSYGGGGIYARNGTMDLRNNIIHGNTAAGNGNQIFVSGAESVANVDYNDIEGPVSGIWKPDGASVIDDGGNINTDPMFFEAVAWVWTSASTYDSSTGITTMHDSSQAWEIDSLAGTLLNPASSSASNLLFYISGNSQNEIYVLGDASIGAGGASYQVLNLRLDPDSLCLNTGSPLGTATDVEGVQRPQGSGFDMGAYEGAAYIPPPAGTTILLYGIK